MKNRSISARIFSLLAGGAILGAVTGGGCVADGEDPWGEEELESNLGTAEGALVSGPEGMPVSCTNDRIISGYNRVLWPISNNSGAYSKDPYYCRGTFSCDTRGGNFTSTCNSVYGWEKVPNRWTIPIINELQDGEAKTLFPFANTSGAYSRYAYRCDGYFSIDTRGAAWTSECDDYPPGDPEHPAGWTKLQNLGCGTPAYDSWSSIKSTNSAYNYATNKRTDTSAIPGRAAGVTIGSSPDSFIDAVVADGLDHVDDINTPCPDASYAKIVGFFQAPGGVPQVHFARKDANGKWSHKPTGQPATNVDANGNLITHPSQLAKPGDQLYYFCTCSDPEKWLGHVWIE